MVNRIIGALLRAFLVLVLITTPSVLVPGVGQDAGQIVTMAALLAAALTFFEYASTYPGLIEFRDSPPFNRIRYLTLFTILISLSVVSRADVDDAVGIQFLNSIGMLVGQSMDFTFSPVRLMTGMLPSDASFDDRAILRAASGMAYLLSLLSMLLFMAVTRPSRWPPRTEDAFNVWVNLPTFDPTTSGDVVVRLHRDARFNVLLGFALPFLVPLIVSAMVALVGTISVEDRLTMVWTIAAWAFLPTGLFMRGVAMHRVARLIEAERGAESNEYAAT